MVDIVQGPIGAVGDYEVDWVGGKLVAKAKVEKAPGKAEMTVELDGIQVWDLLAAKVKAAIPGQVDDVILDLIRGVLLNPPGQS